MNEGPQRDEPPKSQRPAPVHIRIDEAPLTLAALDNAWGRTVHVEIADSVWKRIEESSAAALRIATAPEPAYGINTGFGPLCTRRISLDQVSDLQTNLILSHAAGVGMPVPPEIVRWMMLFKLRALAHGVSGVSRAVVACLRQMLDADVLPIIPRQGSVGASGDLAPLSHMVLPMLGLGRVWHDGKEVESRQALSAAKVEPVTLGPKEGLALINGTQFMTAYAAAILVRARRLAKHADIIAAMSLEGIKGSIRPFDERLMRLRPHPGAVATADNVRRMMAESEILASHVHCPRVQDPYSVRCVPQVHGASRDSLEHAADVVEREINSVTDNPLIVDDDQVISGGLFHGQPVALVLDYLAMALAELASISERRIYLLLTGPAELPELLIEHAGVNSGFMIAQCTAAALVSENKGLCTPASADSIPTSLGQEDHVSMGARAAVKCYDVLENAETVLAIEQLCAAQALDFRAPLKPGVGPRVAHAEIRKVVPFADSDRQLGVDIQTSLALLRSQRALDAVESEVGALH